MYRDKKGFARAENHRDLVAGRWVPRLVVLSETHRLESENVLGVGEKDEVVLLEGVGHWVHQVKSEEVNGIIRKWLEIKG